MHSEEEHLARNVHVKILNIQTGELSFYFFFLIVHFSFIQHPVLRSYEELHVSQTCSVNFSSHCRLLVAVACRRYWSLLCGKPIFVKTHNNQSARVGKSPLCWKYTAKCRKMAFSQHFVNSFDGGNGLFFFIIIIWKKSHTTGWTWSFSLILAYTQHLVRSLGWNWISTRATSLALPSRPKGDSLLLPLYVGLCQCYTHTCICIVSVMEPPRFITNL